MRAILNRYRRTSWLAATALAFQALVLVLQTPMVVARGVGAPAAMADHCEPAARHHGDPGSRDDACQICLGLAAVAHAVGPTTPMLPLPPDTVAMSPVLIAIEAPERDRPTPQNPRAPPLPT